MTTTVFEFNYCLYYRLLSTVPSGSLLYLEGGNVCGRGREAQPRSSHVSSRPQGHGTVTFDSFYYYYVLVLRITAAICYMYIHMYVDVGRIKTPKNHKLKFEARVKFLLLLLLYNIQY